ncbi:hypothetical protein PHAVU_007G087500 [Phaseolus vulgaris]|uniref:Leucine-rich repeat-containing N-terminal plant-type domain-containing protein n=1 Tax=Phaseolus vulgaris TaxID=3885 RepID=V7BCQ7_PHAVU|nr:hypothetical protein PHAVU_007G087500g [Phaseolus vulgaris]ESW15619.1 hypothetical protein PHAVU_007G087500g [Phaseolus vulgaris]
MLNKVTCSFNIRCHHKDKQALFNFKQGIIDPSHALSSWFTQQDCCQWRGVTCDNITSRVTHLSLPCSTTLPTYTDKTNKSLCLTGSIYLSSMDFEFLSYLDLGNNDFLAFQFDSVNHNYQNLSVAVHSRRFVNSSALRYLDLSGNENLAMNSLQWLSRMSSLEHLNLGGIDLRKETNWLQLVTMPSSLSELYLMGCQLENLSPSLQYANFSALRYLALSENEFHSELSKWLFNISHDISRIGFRSCSLRGQLPKELLNLRDLEALVLEDNNFNGPIPDWLGELEHLQYLILRSNLFSGSIPTKLGNLSSLISLTVGENQLAESCPNFPMWLYTQRSLESLAIVESSFEAQGKFWNFLSKIPEVEIEEKLIDGNLSNVVLNSTYIDLSSNGLKGGLPRLSSNVAVVLLSDNLLSGDLTPLLCDHKMLSRESNLLYLDISLNHLSGALTSCWRNKKSLVHVNLGGNNLTGEIPPSMDLLSNLTSLHLHENKLYGQIPFSLKNCHSLLIFNVRDNNLSGNIPHWISLDAKALQLRSNNFTGNIPPQICQMSSLIILDFAHNTISGYITSCLQNITALVFNNASRYRFSYSFPSFHNRYLIMDDGLELVTKGQVSKYEKNLHFVTLIDMSNNNFTGTIPSQMFSLTGLFSLNLSHNSLTGKIPNEIGNMKNLESLDFSVNHFQGEIPQDLSSLSFLSYLNLSFNNLTGQIPSGTQMQGFNVLSYIGNRDLCGPPLTKNCSQDVKPKDKEPTYEDEHKSEFVSWFFIEIESGFVTSFLGVCCAIFFNRKWKHAYFKFLYNLRDRLHVTIVIKTNVFRLH